MHESAYNIKDLVDIDNLNITVKTKEQKEKEEREEDEREVREAQARE